MSEKLRSEVIKVFRQFATNRKMTLDYMYHTGDEQTWFYFYYHGQKYPVLLIWEDVDKQDSYKTYRLFSDVERALDEFMEKNKTTEYARYAEYDVNTTYNMYDKYWKNARELYFENVYKRMANSLYGLNDCYGTTVDRSAQIRKVIFNPPATIVFWADGSKTIVKAHGDDDYDPEKGMAIAFSKKFLGNNHEYYNVFKHWLKKWDKDKEQTMVNDSLEKIKRDAKAITVTEESDS